MNLGGNTGKRIVLCKGWFFFILYENSNLGVGADALSPPAKKICNIIMFYKNINVKRCRGRRPRRPKKKGNIK